MHFDLLFRVNYLVSAGSEIMVHRSGINIIPQNMTFTVFPVVLPAYGARLDDITSDFYTGEPNPDFGQIGNNTLRRHYKVTQHSC